MGGNSSAMSKTTTRPDLERGEGGGGGKHHNSSSANRRRGCCSSVQREDSYRTATICVAVILTICISLFTVCIVLIGDFVMRMASTAEWGRFVYYVLLLTAGITGIIYAAYSAPITRIPDRGTDLDSFDVDLESGGGKTRRPSMNGNTPTATATTTTPPPANAVVQSPPTVTPIPPVVTEPASSPAGATILITSEKRETRNQRGSSGGKRAQTPSNTDRRKTEDSDG